MEDQEYRWKKCDENAAKSILSGTEFPGQVFPMAIKGLPIGIQKMPGLTEAYISGFVTPPKAGPELYGKGELVAVRYEGTTGKGYNWGIVVSGDGTVYCAGPFKYFEGHHFKSGEAVPVEKLFNRSTLSFKTT